MKLILFGDANQPRKAFRQLLGDTGHGLECHSLHEVQTCDLKTCDMVLLDGNARDCAAQRRLLEAAQDLRRIAPRVPIMILSAFDPAADRAAARHGCGVTASGDGKWHMHCRLKELAWRESEALLHDTLEREPLEPVTFEYRG
jgi:CheY-like chemotaxis protein